MESIILITILEFILNDRCNENTKLGYSIMFTALVYSLLRGNYIFFVELIVQLIKYKRRK